MPTHRAVLLLALLSFGPSATAQVSGPTIGGERGEPTSERVGPDWLQLQWARTDLDRLAAALRLELNASGLPAPGVSLRDLLGGKVPEARLIDPWGRDYRLSEQDGLALGSDGPDGRAGSADDLLLRLAGRAEDGPYGTPSVTPLPRGPVAAPPGPAVRSTHRSLGSLARALQSFREQRGHYPVGQDARGLTEALVPEHVRSENFPAVDAWGRPWRYRSNDVGSSYTLVSAGEDGIFETLVPLRAGAVLGAERDLVVVDGRSARWPQGATPHGAVAPPPRSPRARAADPAPRAREPRKAPRNVAEPGKANATLARLERIVAQVQAFRAREGRFPQSDDATRLLRVLSSSEKPVDAWGRRLAYLSLAGGSRAVLASSGANGRFDSGLEAYLRGAPAAGDDLVFVNGTRRR